jgi:hypothetical protein
VAIVLLPLNTLRLLFGLPTEVGAAEQTKYNYYNQCLERAGWERFD